MALDSLAHIAVVTKDAARVTALFGTVLGLARTDVPMGSGRYVPAFSVGETAIVVFDAAEQSLGAGVKPGVHHIAFANDDLELARAFMLSRGLTTKPAERGLGDAARIQLSAAELCGVHAYIAPRLAIERSREGKVERVDHIGIASADNRIAIDAFCNKLGLVLESQQTDMEVQIAVESFTSDKYGAVYHSRPAQIQGGLRVAFITAGDLELEFLQNFDAAQGGFVQRGAAGTTRQDQGAITRFIAGRGAGLHHIAFKVVDINAVLAEVRAGGYATIDSVGRPGSRRAQIGFVQPASLGGLLIHFVQRE